MKYQFIAEHQQEYEVKTMCRALTISESGYYAWKQRGPSRREREDQWLIEQIQQAYQRGRQVYGCPRIHAELRAQGIHCGENRVAHLVLANFLRLPHWYKRFEQRSRYRLVRVSLRLVGELLLPTLILLGLPAQGGYSWPFILRAVPDLGWWILVTTSLSLITGMLTGILVRRALRQKNVAPLKDVPIPSALFE